MVLVYNHIVNLNKYFRKTGFRLILNGYMTSEFNRQGTPQHWSTNYNTKLPNCNKYCNFNPALIIYKFYISTNWTIFVLCWLPKSTTTWPGLLTFPVWLLSWQASLSVAGLRLWNSLPAKIPSKEFVFAFRSQLQNHLYLDWFPLQVVSISSRVPILAFDWTHPGIWLIQ